MPLQPKLRRIVAPPGPPPLNLLTGPTASEVTLTAVRSHLAKSDPSSTAQDPPTPPGRMQFLCVHPCQPLVAYYLEGHQPTAPLTPVKLIQVQHLQTRNVLWTCYLSDLAATLVDYDPMASDAPKRFGSAMKTLGQLQSMAFFDPSTLYFSGMADASPDPTSSATSSGSAGVVERWQTLLVQFSTRIVMLNLRKGPTTTALIPPSNNKTTRNFYSPILCHLTKDNGLNSNPSSNALPLTKSLLLLGCGDGTFKCFDWKKSKLQKSIKGLGKNDWIVHLIAANRYPSLEDPADVAAAAAAAAGGTGGPAPVPTTTTTGDGEKVRRFITLTKKGTAYLIEVAVTPDAIDIRPPLARFEGGAAPSPLDGAELLQGWEHTLLHYDADRDIFMWGQPAQRNKQPQKTLCWDLASLREQLQAQKGQKSVYKPEPTLIIQFPFENPVVVHPAWSHPAFPEDVIVCAVVTKSGDLHIMGATNAGTSGSATVMASPITSTNMCAVIQRDTGMVTGPILQVHFVGCAALWDSSVLLVGSNLGVLMVDFESQYSVPGSRHCHFGAGLGSLGKSVLCVKHSLVLYGSVDAFRANPVGPLEAKNLVDVYESPPAVHLPAEIQKRPFRLPPCFLISPSGMFVCLYWNEEMRYEVLHVPSVLQRASQRNKETPSSSASVASGSGVSSFAWVGEHDVFAVIHSPEADKLGQATIFDAATPTVADGKDFAFNTQKLKDLTDVRALDFKEAAKGATKVVTSTAKIATTTAAKAGFTATKAVTGATVNATTKVVGTTAAVTAKTAGVIGDAAHKTAKVFTFGRFRGKKKQPDQSGGLTADDEDYDDGPSTFSSLTPMMQPGMYDPNKDSRLQGPKAFVELRELKLVETAQPSALSGSIAPATSISAGNLDLRGGNRIPPKVLFGGPVLCVGCRSDDEEGVAYFYTRKKDAAENHASNFASSGPSMPFPDLVAWDDDGRLCAVVMHSRIAIYLNEQPNFVLLGNVRVGSPADPDGAAISVKFVHGVLYCCTRNSIECIFLGDMENSRICHLDSHVIASTDVHTLPGKTIVSSYSSLTPPTLPMPLNHPVVLGYQSGSLIVSTVRGVVAVPLCHPLLRIGSLLAAGQSARAQNWFNAVPDSDHESLAVFLDRRGFPDLAVDLPGLSLESTIDFCMRYGYVDRLEQAVEEFGVVGLRSIDMGRSLSSSIFGPEEYGHSVGVCVGVYLLAHGRIDAVRRLASEYLKYGDDARKDAFVLATLLLSVDRIDARRILGRAVQDSNGSDDWAIGSFVRDHLLSSSRSEPT